jgi:predicted dehydrogenase
MDKASQRLARHSSVRGTDVRTQPKYKAGLIGCGAIARNHAEAYDALPDVGLIAAADINPDSLKTIASEFGVANQYENYREMLSRESLDVVSICTWPGLHAEMTVEAAKSGVKAILCEKPIALTLGEADAMIEACESCQVKLVINHQHRFNPYFSEAKRLIESGAIGAVSLAWGHIRDSLLNNGTHLVDVMRYILGDPDTEWIMGQIERKKDSYNRGHEVEETAEGVIQFANGTRGLVETGEMAIPELRLLFYGREGQLEVSARELRVRGRKRRNWQQLQLGQGSSQMSQAKELLSLLDGRVTSHRADAAQARTTLEILLGIFESVRIHGVVRPPLALRNESPLNVMLRENVL